MFKVISYTDYCDPIHANHQSYDIGITCLCRLRSALALYAVAYQIQGSLASFKCIHIHMMTYIHGSAIFYYNLIGFHLAVPDKVENSASHLEPGGQGHWSRSMIFYLASHMMQIIKCG